MPGEWRHRVNRGDNTCKPPPLKAGILGMLSAAAVPAHVCSSIERQVEEVDMAKERRAPPYMRWDQRGRPVLQATLKLPDGTTVRAMLNTDDRKIAVRRMQLIVVLLVRDGRLPANSSAAQLYGRRPARGVAEVKRLAALSPEEYAVVRKTAAAGLGLSPPTLDDLSKQQPELPNREPQRRHRARQRGQRIAMANFWYHRPPRGMGFYKNGRVMTARIHLARSTTTWSLKFRDDAARAAAIMNPVRVAWDQVYEAAKRELKWEIGTAEHTAAVAARVEACGRLAREIHAAGGPKELVAFVMTPPQPQLGTAVAAPPTGKTLRQIARKGCLESLIGLLRRHDLPPQGTVAAQCEAAMREFTGLSERAFYNCLREAERITGNAKWGKAGRRQESPH